MTPQISQLARKPPQGEDNEWPRIRELIWQITASGLG